MSTTASSPEKNSKSLPKDLCRRPVGLFDSGVGGLTILREVVKFLPQESVIYLGDTARLPYGDKSAETVIHYARQSAQFLMQRGIKVLVLACHTASSHALHTLQIELPIPVLGVTTAGIKKALEQTSHGRIGVLGTRATILAGVYQRELTKTSHVEVHAVPCPLFVPLVEERYYSHPASALIAQEYLQPLRQANVDTVILGCTHYPMLASVIQEYLGDTVTLIDCGQACAEALQQTLQMTETLNHQTQPVYEYFVTDDPQKFQRTGADILGKEINAVQHCIVNGERAPARSFLYEEAPP